LTAVKGNDRGIRTMTRSACRAPAGHDPPLHEFPARSWNRQALPQEPAARANLVGEGRAPEAPGQLNADLLEVARAAKEAAVARLKSRAGALSVREASACLRSIGPNETDT
jgi:hypothetical protein